MQIGKLAFVFLQLSGTGTSNTTAFTVTGLPFTAKSGSSFRQEVPSVVDNGTTLATGISDIVTTTASIYSTHAGAGWTASGTKGFTSIMWIYEVN